MNALCVEGLILSNVCVLSSRNTPGITQQQNFSDKINTMPVYERGGEPYFTGFLLVSKQVSKMVSVKDTTSLG